MRLSWRRITIRPRRRFATSQGGIDSKQVLWVEIEHDGVVGCGEAVPSELYGQTIDTSAAALDAMGALLGDDPFAIEAVVRRLLARFDGQRAAVAAVDNALHDWCGKRLGVPCWRLLGMERPRVRTTFTIGVSGVEETREKVREALAEGFDALKVKVGVADDERTLEIVREGFGGPLFLDANEGWSADEAPRRIESLARFRPVLIEQPLRRADWRRLGELRGLGVAPIFVDESCERPSDVGRLAGLVDGINVKLNKCGGIREALRMIHAARALGLGVMLGCFVSSSLAIAPALTIAGLVDYADLDGHLLLERDPYQGIERSGGEIGLGQQAGLGVRPRGAGD